VQRLELLRAMNDVVRVGRFAQACARITVGSNMWLECRVDTNRPPTFDPADDSIFRFGVEGGEFKWLRQVSGTFEPYFSYKSMTRFEVCDDALMTSGCPLP